MNFNPHLYRYPSRRSAVYAARGVVATSDPLAAQAGLDMMKAGGNAIDAAVAAAACLAVTEPVSNGIGSDAFALVWSGGKLHGLNASGWAPKALNADSVLGKGFSGMPVHAWESVTVPGAPSAWAALSAKFGRLPFGRLFAPAVFYARQGFPLAVDVAKHWKRAHDEYANVLKGDMFKAWFEVFAPKGCPKAGNVWKYEATAQTLEEIASTGAESFYRGKLAEKICAFSRKTGGYLDEADFAEFYPEWVEPVGADYRGWGVHEIPPSGQGITALMALNILKGFDFGEKETPETYHRQIEAMKLAFADAKEFIAEPGAMRVSASELLSEAYAAKRRALIGERAALPVCGNPRGSGTVYLAAADGEGNMVSYIQSNYMGFGSGIVVPETGIALQNRGNNFSLDKNHANCLAPRKRPYHTIIPAFLTRGGEPVGPFGVMGGFMQPQGHVQVVMNTVDFGMNPQEALDAPRWQWEGGLRVSLESGVPRHIAGDLANRGHEISVLHDYGSMGRGQIIWRTESGALCAGTEPRTDGAVAAF